MKNTVDKLRNKKKHELIDVLEGFVLKGTLIYVIKSCTKFQSKDFLHCKYDQLCVLNK